MARKTALKLAEEKRQEAEHQLATVTALAEAEAMKRSLTLLEAPQPVVTPWNEYPQYDDFSRWPSVFQGGYPWTNLDDRTGERYRPLYENAADLRMIRASARKMAALFPIVQGAIASLTNYVIAGGYEYEVQTEQPELKRLLPAVQECLDEFLERNDFSGCLEREIHAQSRQDGEALIGLFWDGKCQDEIRVELVNPDFIVEPANATQLERYLRCGHKLSAWWLGVHTTYDQELKRDDVYRPHGYHVVYDTEGDQWDYLPTCRCELIKRNVGRDARRGVSDLFAVQKDLELEAKIRRNTAEGAAILAAIVMIRQHAEGVSKSSVQSLAQTNATTSYDKQKDSGSSTTYAEQIRPGTVKDTPFGMTTTVGPLGTLRSPVYIEVAQYLLRIIGTRWCMPEYIVSSDASNGNYASTQVAGNPFVRARESDQAFYAHHFESLIWKALRMYYEAGRFKGANWQTLRSGLTLKVDYASPATRDKSEQANTNKLLMDAGVMSKRTAAADMGLDWDEEQAELAKEPKPAAPHSPFGLAQRPLPFGNPAATPAPTGMGNPLDRDGDGTYPESYVESLAARALQRLTEGV